MIQAGLLSMSNIQIFIDDYRKWPNVYWVFGIYASLCAALVAFAPADYQSHLPASSAFAAISSFPATTAFAIEGMWALLPIALIALSLVTPIRIRTGFDITDVFPTALIFIVFGLAVTLFLAYFGLFVQNVNIEHPYMRLDRLILNASHSKPSLAIFLTWYFWGMLSTTWISYVAIPTSILRLVNQPEPENRFKPESIRNRLKP